MLLLLPSEVSRCNRVTVDSEVRIKSSISVDDLTGPVKVARIKSSISVDDLTGLLGSILTMSNISLVRSCI